VQRLRDAEITVVCQVGSLAEARAAEHAGAQGFCRKSSPETAAVYDRRQRVRQGGG
jgi:hypothetical protein